MPRRLFVLPHARQLVQVPAEIHLTTRITDCVRMVGYPSISFGNRRPGLTLWHGPLPLRLGVNWAKQTKSHA
jgi:hypothetical protein